MPDATPLQPKDFSSDLDEFARGGGAAPSELLLVLPEIGDDLDLEDQAGGRE